MAYKTISRRDILRTLGLSISAGSVLELIPIRAAQHVHKMIKAAKAKAPEGAYTPRFFTAHQYKTLQRLCQTIIPPDDHSGGAIEAGAPEFIDLLTSENPAYQKKLGGGLIWLDAACGKRYRKVYLDCSPAEQKEILELIAYGANSRKDPTLNPGIRFFSFLRDLTTDGFYTSEIGIQDLQFIGNTFVEEFPGCPPLPET